MVSADTVKTVLAGLSLAQANANFFKLCPGHFTWRVGQQTGRGLSLGKCDHVADTGCTCHQHDQAVQTKGDTPVRWAPVLECFQQKAKFMLCFLSIDTQDIEDCRLHGRIMDTDRTATDSVPFSTMS
jgi:hypothetical protein